MSNGWVKTLAKGAVAGISSYVTTTYIIPLGITVVTIVFARVSGLPWFLVWMSGLAAFAFISTGLLRFSEWRFRQQVRDKLAFESVILGNDIRTGGLCIGFQLRNSATFPIEYKRTKLITRLGDKVPSKTTYEGPDTIVVPAAGTNKFADNAITVEKVPAPGTLEGYIEYELLYGRSGRLRYPLVGKKHVIFGFDSRG
jgi:hypothetical protein